MRAPSAQQEIEEIDKGILEVEAVADICPEWTFKIKVMPIWREVQHVMKRINAVRGLVGLLAILTLSIQISFNAETSGQALYHITKFSSKQHS